MKTTAQLYTIYDLPIFSGGYGDIIQIVDKHVREKRGGYVCVTGIHGISEAVQHKKVYAAHKNALYIVPDGMPLVWVGRLSGYTRTRRIYGPDFMRHVCALAERKGYRIGLYGSEKKVIHALVRNLLNTYPKLRIVAAISPTQQETGTRSVQEEINALQTSTPDIVFVGLGTPKQEVWMDTHNKHVPGAVCIGVGAAFDFLSGNKHQAPVWMRSFGLEWVFRLMQEPGRLGRRYVLGVRYAALPLVRSVMHGIINRFI